VIGEAEGDARRTLIQAGFTVRSADLPTVDPAQNGRVLKQEPAGGGRSPVGAQITIYVGRLPAPTD
jgi:beta-lactam-binding protein with PASTA domain